LVTGALLDYVSASILGAVAFGGAAVGIAMLLGGNTSPLPVQADVVLIGMALGVEGDLIAYMVRRLFGLRAYATIYGYLFSAFNVGGIVGPVIMGATFDARGSYDIGLYMMSGFAAGAALLMLMPMPRPQPGRSTAPSNVAV
jgi:hypothetical protein